MDFQGRILSWKIVRSHPPWDPHRFEQMELPAKLLDYFVWSNKSNINQKGSIQPLYS